MPNSSYSNQMMRTHWGDDAEGVLAHARIQDFNANGKKMLFIEEIQSDWHNEGHKNGYETEEYTRLAKEEETLREELSILSAKLRRAYDTPGEVPLREEKKSLEKKLREISLKRRTVGVVGAVPDAPFKDTYHEFVMKRLLRMAAENGYDSIGWTPAEIQSKRWSDEYAEGYRIEYDQDIPKFLRKYGRQWGANVSKTALDGVGSGARFVTDTGREFSTWVDARNAVVEEANKLLAELGEDDRVSVRDTTTTTDGNEIKVFDGLGRELGTITNMGNSTEVWSMDITDSMKNSVLYEGQTMFQYKGDEPIDNRELLANALKRAATTDLEKQKIKEYQKKINSINTEEKKLRELKGQIKELSFAKGPRDTEKIKSLQYEANKIANRIKVYDKQLLRLEATKPLMEVVHREKDLLRKKMEQRQRAAVQAVKERDMATIREIMNRNTESRKKAVEGRSKTQMRHKIRKVVKELNSLFKNGTKKKNIKEEMKDTVASALALADVLFNDSIKNEDIVRLGVASVTEKESILLNEYRDLLDKRDALLADIESIYGNAQVAEDMLEKVGTLEAEVAKTKNRMSTLDRKLSEVFERERARLNRATVDSLINEIVTEYSKLKDSENGYIQNAHSEAMEKRLVALKESLQGAVVKDMNIPQLTELYDAFTAIMHMIRHSNSLFREGRTEDLMTYISNVQGELYEASAEQKDRNIIVDKVASTLNEFSWNNLRPVDAVERLGSQTFEKLYWDYVHAMGVAARDIVEAGEVIANAREKCGYSSWNMELADTTFTTRDGLEFKPSLADKLSIYAYSQRDQAEGHMVDGGFTYDTGRTYKEKENGTTYVRRKLSSTYRLSKEDIGRIISSLKQEHKNYVNAILPYLTDMGKKGNEVSMTLYGIELFGEKVYFPLQSSRDYLNTTTQTLGTTPTMTSLANSGFTNQTKPGANNPIVLRGFDDVVHEHIEKMSNYHALVIPIENLRRVFDNVGRGTEGNPISTKALIGSRFGEEAQRYINQMLTDFNGGVTPSGAKSILGKLFSRAKGMSVSGNLSVVAQQYFSIIRAMEVVPPKYFTPFLYGDAKKTDTKQYEELLKYAPIAIIKEMGGFDVGSRGRVKDYIGYNGARKDLKYIKKKADDVWMWGAGKMDKLGWVSIWKAVKAEVASEQKLTPGTDAFYEACRIRFTEVVTKTQVFDSVASRSGYMRSQHDSVKYATAFMGEPTAIAGRIFGAVTNLVRATKSKDKAKIQSATLRFVRTAAVIAVANVLGKLASSLVYAGRDDEEDEALLERWAKHFGSALAEDFKPYGFANYLPFGRDIVSLIEGYSVERPDTTLVEDIIKASKKMLDGDITFDDSLDFIGSVGNFFGQPFKNVIREVESAINVVGDIFDDIQPTNVDEAFVRGFTGDKKDRGDALYDAIVSGDTARLAVYKKGYKEEDSYKTAKRKALRENDDRITEAAQARLDGDAEEYKRIAREIVAEGHFTQDDVVAAINATMRDLTEDTEEDAEEKAEDTKATSYFSASDTNLALEKGNATTARKIIDELIQVKIENYMASGVKKSEAKKKAEASVKSSITSYWKPLYLEAKANKNLSEVQRIKAILRATKLYDNVTETTDDWWDAYRKSK